MLPNWIYGKYPQSEIIIKHIDGWVHDCGSSSELATETLHSCIKRLTQSAEIPLPILELPLDNKTVIWNNLWIVITIKVMPSIRFIILQSWSTRFKEVILSMKVQCKWGTTYQSRYKSMLPIEKYVSLVLINQYRKTLVPRTSGYYSKNAIFNLSISTKPLLKLECGWLITHHRQERH